MMIDNPNQYLRFRALCCKIRNNRDATRLWNYADHLLDCEPYFAALAEIYPQAFVDPRNVNTIRFTY